MGTTAQRTLAIAVTVTLSAVCGFASADAPDDVPEAADYELLYRLDIPDAAAFNTNGVPYGTDRAEAIGTFDRVGWYLELQREGEPRRWVWVSGRAFTSVPAAVGVPYTGTGGGFQRSLDEMNVRSNAPGITQRTDHTGWLEFWATNYGAMNSARVPGASDTIYDHGDQPIDSGGYGSMQVHDVSAATTLFAYNRWGIGGGDSDLGIGNSDGEHRDWTFVGSAREYTLKRLSVYVRPGPTPPGLAVVVTEPGACTIAQRQPGNVGRLAVRGRLTMQAQRIDARLVPVVDGWGTASEWQLIDDRPSGRSFAGVVEGVAGYYDLEVRAEVNGQPSVTRAGPIGIGEIFVIAGQSNSANHGEVVTAPSDPRVCGFNGTTWAPGADPQPLATGQSGSPWPSFGDAVAARFGVPVGIVSVGVGGTAVDQWRPASVDGLYVRLETQLRALGPHGARAVLWHQGESDAARGTTQLDYAHQLEEVIAASRIDAAWEVPWGIARAAYLPNLDQSRLDAVIAGQDAVVAGDPLVFAGPSTEDLLGTMWRYDRVHFNEAGLIEHGQRWADAIEMPRCQGFGNDEGCEEPGDVGVDVGQDVPLVDASDADAEAGDLDVEEADVVADVSTDVPRGNDAAADAPDDATDMSSGGVDVGVDGSGADGDDPGTGDSSQQPTAAEDSGCGCETVPRSRLDWWRRR